MAKDNHHLTTPHSFFSRKLLSRTVYLLLLLVLLHLYFFLRPPSSLSPPTTPPPSQENRTTEKPPQYCEYSKGEWIYEESIREVYNYSFRSCSSNIKPGQNCRAHGRPDTHYLHYRWRPSGCPLPVFDPPVFLSLLRNSHLAFVGDSIARNQLESLVCLLSYSSTPTLVYNRDDKFRRWRFDDYNATVSVYWSPFLVEGVEKNEKVGLDHNELYLDVVDGKWLDELKDIHVLVLSAGHWFLHPAVYFNGKTVIGCHHCPGKNFTEVGFYGVFKTAFETALIGALRGGVGNVVVTTFSPAHFEKAWDDPLSCARKEPFKVGEKVVEGMDLEMWKSQLEAVAAATAKGGYKVEVLDVTELALLRPDGHPAAYMNAFPFANGVPKRVQNDCVHWCLPGPVDAWNEIFLEILKRWRV